MRRPHPRRAGPRLPALDLPPGGSHSILGEALESVEVEGAFRAFNRPTLADLRGRRIVYCARRVGDATLVNIEPLLALYAPQIETRDQVDDATEEIASLFEEYTSDNPVFESVLATAEQWLELIRSEELRYAAALFGPGGPTTLGLLRVQLARITAPPMTDVLEELGIIDGWQTEEEIERTVIAGAVGEMPKQFGRGPYEQSVCMTTERLKPAVRALLEDYTEERDEEQLKDLLRAAQEPEAGTA